MSDNLDGEFSPYHTARGTIYVMSRSVVLSITNAVFFILIARFLPHVSDLGIYQGIQSLIMFSTTLAGADISRAATRYISYYIGSGNNKLAERIYPSIFGFGIIFSVIISTILYSLSYYITIIFFHNDHYLQLIHLSIVDIFLFTAITYSISLLYSMQAFKKSVSISILNTVIKFGAAFVLVISGLNIMGIVLGFIIGDTIALVLFISVLIPKLRSKPSPWTDIKPLIRFAGPLYGSSILVYLSREVDVYMLLLLSKLDVVGLYSPAVFFGYILLLVQTSLDQSLAPFFSRVYGRSGMESLHEFSFLASRYVFLIYFPVGFLVFASSPLVITGILGERYEPSIYPTMIIIISLTFTGMTPVFNNILMSSGHSNVFLKASGLALIVQLIISFLTIPSAGGIGASIAKGIAYLVLFLYPVLELRKISRLNYDLKSFKLGLFGSLVLAATILILNYYISKAYFIPVSIIVSSICYLLFIRFTGAIIPTDLEILDKIFAGKARRLTIIIGRLVIK